MSFGVRVIPTVRVVSSLLVSTTPLSHRYFIYISSLHTHHFGSALRIQRDRVYFELLYMSTLADHIHG